MRTYHNDRAQMVVRRRIEVDDLNSQTVAKCNVKDYSPSWKTGERISDGERASDEAVDALTTDGRLLAGLEEGLSGALDFGIVPTLACRCKNASCSAMECFLRCFFFPPTMVTAVCFLLIASSMGTLALRLNITPRLE